MAEVVVIVVTVLSLVATAIAGTIADISLDTVKDSYNATVTDVERLDKVEAVSSNLSNLLTLLGYTQSRQTEMAILTSIMSSFLGMIATGKFAALVVPTLVSYVILPAFAIIKSIAKTLVIFGLGAWILATMAPMLMTWIGLTSAGMFVSRAMHNAAGPFSPYLNPQSITTRGLQLLDIDTIECRKQLACKAGEVFSMSHPEVQYYLNSSGVIDWLAYTHRDEPYTTIALRVVKGDQECEELPPCERLRILEAYLDPSILKREAMNFFTTTTTTTPSPISLPSSPNEVILSALKRWALSYYAYDTSSSRHV